MNDKRLDGFMLYLLATKYNEKELIKKLKRMYKEVINSGL